MEQRFNPFGDSPRDRNNAVRWITKQLNRLLPSILDPDLESQIDEYLNELGGLEHFLIENAEAPETEFSDYFLDAFSPIFDFASELHKEKKGEGLIFGSWRSDERRTLNHGHSECHEKTVIRVQSATAVHHYSCVPQSSVWECTPVTQHGRTFYLVIAKVSEIDAVCCVPSFSRTLTTTESGLRVLDRNREPREWQRNPDTSRIDGISSFIGDKRNIVANTPLVFAPESEHVTYERREDGTIERVNISFDFLAEDGDSLSDHSGLQDLRPMWLIDGQHRVRGIARNPISTELEIPFVFFPDELGVNYAAKIFAEVNTLARELTDLHKLFMMHRFELPSHSPTADFRPLSGGLPEEANSWKNTMSYECAAFLTSKKGSPLKSLIQIHDENSRKNHIIDAKMFMKFSRNWFRERGPYSRDCGLDKEEIFGEILSYFLAIEAVVNHMLFFEGAPDAWSDSHLRWSRRNITRSGLQTKRNFRSLLVNLPLAIELCSGEDRPISKSRFEKIMFPLSWVDWNSQEFKKKYIDPTGEVPWQGLAEWIRNAIIEGEAYPLDEVMTESEEFEALPGRGLLCRPKQPIIFLEEGSPSWPSKGDPVILISERPVNTLANVRWKITDARGNPRDQRVKMKAGSDGICRYTVEYKTWMNPNQSTGVGAKMTVNVSWRNGFATSGTDIVLENPG